MKLKSIFYLTFICLLFFLNPISVKSAGELELCNPAATSGPEKCENGLICVFINSSFARCERVTTPQTPPSAVEKVIGQITPPPQVQALGVGGAGIGRFLGNLIRIIFLFAGIVAIFMILISAFQMITSGGDKEAVAKARGRLTYAIIGLTLLALTFVIINVISRLTGFQFPISQR